MYAVVETGGKQYRALPGQFIDVEKLPVAVGEQITLDRVLLVADDEQIVIGQPLIEGATVRATVVLQDKQRKVIFFHYVPKKRQRKKRGHRQPFTRLRIESVDLA
ncbi:MAG: 50S ribosomal protein L21 [Chloroflexi bacterium ADurb.Bin325]|nr:MAG: 50S ribosomal protein L21 [Chloroflexi bacterium ADurb.Bin325]